MATTPVNKIHLRLLLIGKTGHGKSATGNSILNRKEFKSSSTTTSVTKDVVDAYAETDLFSIQVVDGPGLEDPGLSEKQNIETACKNMTKALLLCNGGVHIFVLVLKFGERFTLEEKKTVTTLKDIFGPNYLKERGIIVLTRGDLFPVLMNAENTPEKTFMEWCRDQKEDIKTLFQECSYRILLFNNVTTDEKENNRQRNEFLQEAHKISNKRGLYTNETFQKFAELREKLIKSKLTIFRESVQRMINLLTSALGSLTESSSDKDIEKVKMQTIDLQQEIEAQGVDDSVKEIMSILDKVLTNLQELIQGKNKKSVIQKLQKQKEELAGKRRDKIPWNKIFIGFGIGVGVVFAGAGFVGGIVAIVLAGGGPMLARVAVTAVTAIVRSVHRN